MKAAPPIAGGAAQAAEMPRLQGAVSASAYKWYALGALMLISLFNYLDRQSLAILQIPIKRELGLSDTQLGALTGLAFAILYSTFALPVARLADRYRRTYLLGAALAIWSLMTAASGLAVGMVTLTLCRMGVAFGEAGCVPATHSIICDYFPRNRRATAIAIWALSFPVGTMLGFLAGGWLSKTFGWRHAFEILGATGLCFIPLVLTLREPVRGATEPPGAASGEPLKLGAAIRTLWSLPAFRHATFAGALIDFTLYATLNWNAPFYNRVFGLSMQELAGKLALLTGAGTAIGVLLGGTLADRLGRRDPRWYMWVPAIAAAGAVPFMMIQYFASNAQLSLLTGVVPTALVSSFMAPLVATAQSLVSPRMRAFTSAVLALTVGIIGLGLGPLVTGMLSDFLIHSYGMEKDSLRYAIAASAVPAAWACAHFLRAAHHLRRDN